MGFVFDLRAGENVAMSVYDDFDGGGLYGGCSEPAADIPPSPVSSEALTVLQPCGPGPGDSPVSVVSADPVSSGPSIPFGLAILGVCAVAVIWAASLDGGKE
jgi:hypothetical protein